MEAVALAMPVFLLFMWVEYYFSRKNGKKYYSFPDTVSNLSIGILDRITSLIFTGFFYFIYDALQKNYGFINIENIWYNWIILFVLVDFLWYWYHRSSHEVNLFWTVHVVHHQSEEFNFSVGTRITLLQTFVRLLFWGILPIIGFPAYMLIPTMLGYGTYSFFVHTRFIGRLGFLEYILVTPSNHRVHHGSNEEYLDKNYGGVFIIWDLLFGTYAKEEKSIHFGLTKPLKSKSLLWQIFHFFVELFYDIKQTKGFLNKIKLAFGKPDLVDPTLRDKLEPVFLSTARNKKLSPLFRNYIYVQLAISIFVMVSLLYSYTNLSLQNLLASSLLIIITLVNCGAILEQKQWIFYLEYARFIFSVALILYTSPVQAIWTVGILLIVSSLLWFDRLKRYYLLKMSVDRETDRLN